MDTGLQKRRDAANVFIDMFGIIFFKSVVLFSKSLTQAEKDAFWQCSQRGYQGATELVTPELDARFKEIQKEVGFLAGGSASSSASIDKSSFRQASEEDQKKCFVMSVVIALTNRDQPNDAFWEEWRSLFGSNTDEIIDIMAASLSKQFSAVAVVMQVGMLVLDEEEVCRMISEPFDKAYEEIPLFKLPLAATTIPKARFKKAMVCMVVYSVKQSIVK